MDQYRRDRTNIDRALGLYWTSIVDIGPPLTQHWANDVYGCWNWARDNGLVYDELGCNFKDFLPDTELNLPLFKLETANARSLS